MGKREKCQTCGRGHNTRDGARRCVVRSLKDSEDQRLAAARMYGAGVCRRCKAAPPTSKGPGDLCEQCMDEIIDEKDAVLRMEVDMELRDEMER